MILSRSAVASALVALMLTLSFSAVCQGTAASDAGTTVSSLPEVDPVASAKSSTAPVSLRSEHIQPKPIALASTEALTARTQRREDLLSSRTIVLATWKGGQLTNQDLSATLALRKPRQFGNLTPEQIMGSNDAQLRNAVRSIVYEMILENDARKAGISEETSGIKERLKDYRTQTLNHLFYERDVKPLMDRMDEKSALKYYQDNKQRLYTAPERWLVQDIHFDTYEPYEVRPGDTLEKIAAKISGTESAAGRILRNDALRYPRKPRHAGVPFEPVKPGEKLLVPISKEEVTSKTALAEKIQKRAAQGEDFAKLALEFSETTPARAATFEPDLSGYAPQVSNAILKVDTKTSVTPVLTLPYGIDIFRLVDHLTTSPLTFEQVRKSIEVPEADRQKNAEQLRRELFDKLREQFGMQINTDALKRADYAGDNPLTADTVIVSAPDFKYTLDQFQADMAPTMKSWTGMTYQERLDLAKSAPTVVQYLSTRGAHEAHLDESDEFKQDMASKAVIEITSEYIGRLLRETRNPSEPVLRDFYLQHADLYTSPARATLREISKRVDVLQAPEKRNAAIEQAKTQLTAIRSQIKSQADFESIARRESEALSTRSHGGLIGTVPINFRGDAFANQVAQLKPGEISQPFLHGGEMTIVRLDDIIPASVMPFEEVIPKVRIDYLKQKATPLSSEVRDMRLSQEGFELKF